MVEYCTASDVSQFLILKAEVAKDLRIDAASAQKDVDMGSNVIYFRKGDEVIIWDDDEPTGESGVVASIAGLVVTLTDDLAFTYEAVKNAQMQNQSKFHARSKPTVTQVEALITANEGIIDEEVHTSFKSTGVRRQEWVTVEYSTHIRYPNLNSPIQYRFDTYRPIHFKASPMEPLSHLLSDVVEYIDGDSRVNIVNPLSGVLIWDQKVDTIVDGEDLSAGSPITCTLESTSMRLARYLHFYLTHSNITEYTLVITGVKAEDGTALIETFTEDNGWEAYTQNAYSSIVSVVFTRDAGAGTDDVLILDTEPGTSRLSDSYDWWADYEHGVMYPKNTIIELGKKTIWAEYRQGFYTSLGGVPDIIKRSCILLTAIDLLSNERYAHNLPGGEGAKSAIDLANQCTRWRKRYEKLISRKREIYGGTPYA